MRTSEVDPAASGEIEVAVPRKPARLVDVKKVIVDRQMLQTTRRLRALR